MSEFQGLHNPERHKSVSGEWAECLPELGGCLAECGDGDPCRCCLAAEVERLTAELADRDRRIEEALNLHYSQCCKLEPPCMEAAILLGQYTLRGES